MDHFRIDDCSQHEPEIVPLMGLLTYDGGSWAQFPERMGLELDFYKLVSVQEGAGRQFPVVSLSQDQFFSMIQEWLFFGSLIETFRILGLQVTREDFISRRQGQQTLCTRRFAELFRELMQKRADDQLPWTEDMNREIDLDVMVDCLCSKHPVDVVRPQRMKIMETTSPEDFVQDLNMDVETFRLQARSWFAAKAARNSPETQASLTAITQVLDTATSFLYNADRYLGEVGLRDVAESAHMLSSILILQSLEKMAEKLLGRVVMVATIGMLHGSQAVMKRFRDSGLCPTRSAYLTMPTRAYVASTLDRPVRGDHSHCTSRSCNVTSINFSELPRHREHCGGSCMNVGLRDEESHTLHNALRTGSYAMIERNANHEYVDTLRVRDSRDTANGYIVFSHVWSHALGNQKANSLPQCQMAYLSRLCTELDAEVSGLWIDTLLVPLDPQTRRLTISRMASIYRNAKAMIVLDHDLGAVQGPRTHRALQVALCDWITRLWTFQEGWMALYKTYFAFKDRLVSIYELSQGLYHLDSLHEILAGPYHPVRLGKGLHWELGEAERFEANRRGDLMELAQSLQMRTTTRASDEAICLATMLGLDVLKLPLRPDLEDMYRIADGALPMELMFVEGARSDVEGFRWAPRTLLSRNAKPPGSIAPSTRTTVGPKGIRMVKDVLFPVDGLLSLPEKREPLFLIRRTASEAAGSSSWTIQIGDANEEDGRFAAQVLKDAAIVLITRPEFIAELVGLASADISGLSLPAVLVTGLSSEGEHGMCAHFAMNTTVIFAGSPMESYFERFPCLEASIHEECAMWID